MQPQTAEGQAILERPTGFGAAPKSTRCTACSRRTPTCLPKCGYCGADNPDYSEIADAVARGTKHGGYLKSQPPAADTDAVLSGMEPGVKANLARWSGDLMSEMRRRIRRASERDKGDVVTKRALMPLNPTARSILYPEALF